MKSLIFLNPFCIFSALTADINMMKNNFCHITDADKNEIILLMQEQKISCQENL